MPVVSIHAPAWGATPCGVVEARHFLSFNPRTRVGCDAAPGAHDGRGLPVSIHAPAWGATSQPITPSSAPAGFNPRTRVGCDTHARFGYVPVQPRFNPRTRVGCDFSGSDSINNLLTFQSTHPRGVRPCQKVCPQGVFWFQSTHPRGVRHAGKSGGPWRRAAFQSTHPRGVRLLLTAAIRLPGVFQSTHPRGVRRHAYQSLPALFCFNPRTRVGCDWMPRRCLTLLPPFQSTHPRGVRLFPCFIQ